MSDKLNIYVDAKDLNDLTILAKRAKEAQAILDNMHDYQMNYFESQLKSAKEVLEYIPEKDYHLYKSIDRIKSIASESEKHSKIKGFIVDTEKHNIIEVIYNYADYYWGCSFFSKVQFSFNKDYSVLFAKIIHEVHKGTCRSYKQCTCNNNWTLEYLFNTTNNTFIKEISYKNPSSQMHNLVM